MRRPGGAIAEILAAAILTGSAVGGLLLYNSDHRDATAIAAFNAAVKRASGPAAPLEERRRPWGLVSVYSVIDDGTLNPVPQGIAADIWSGFMRMATPAFAADRMSEFVVASAPDRPITASVERASIRPSRWTLVVNTARAVDPADYLRTLVHEYGHLLTLSDDQVDPSVRQCRTTSVQEGCALADSTLERFQQRFWAGYGELAPDPDSQSSSRRWSMYLGRTNDFVSLYAATNVVEDIAETFAEFVIRDRPSPSSGTWARKILFFWEDPEYVAIRARIRHWFGEELPRPLLPSSDAHRG